MEHLKNETSALLFSANDFHEATMRMKRSGNSFERKFVDFRLLDAVQALEFLEPDEVDQIKEAVRDRSVTKFFKNAYVTMEQFDHFVTGSDVPNFVWNDHFKAASAYLVKQLRVERLVPQIYNDQEQLLEGFTNKNASAGAIAIGPKKDNIEKIFSVYQSIKRSIAEGNNPSIPALSFHRSQISGYMSDGRFNSSGLKKKDRLVWGIDAGTVAVEAQYAQPLIDFMSRYCQWYAGGKDPISLRSTISHMYQQTGKWYSLDFSMFDQTIPSWLIEHVFWIIKQFYSEDYHSELDWIRDNFINTSIILYDGSVKTKHRGIPSGSHFTQLVGSMCNMLIILTYLASKSDLGSIPEMVNYLHSRFPIQERECGMYVMGDDNLFFSVKPVDIKDLSGYVRHNFGMTIHPDKTDKCEDGSLRPKFLKRTWSRQGEYRNIVEMLINSIHPERERDYDGKGFSPYHIIYGLYLTYRMAFRNVDEGEIIRKMNIEGGVKALRDLEINDLPGSLRILGDEAVRKLYRRAKAFIEDTGGTVQ